MYTETLEQLLVRAKTDKPGHMSVNDLVELAYKSGAHDEFYKQSKIISTIQSALKKYGDHINYCVRLSWCAGEPTEGGGYRQKFGDKWYQVKPIDETPKCTCGFDKALNEVLIEKKP